MILKEKACENIEGKGENADNQSFKVMFSNLSFKNILSFVTHFILESANEN